MRTVLLTVMLVALGCGAGSSPDGGDASADGAAGGDGGDSGACFPFCSSSSSSGSGPLDAASDAPLSCPQLSAEVTSLQGPAQSCNPALPNQCGGATEGPCCAITVTAGNDMAINAYTSAAAAYKMQCNPSCMGPVCPTVPSHQCTALSTGGGSCQ